MAGSAPADAAHNYRWFMFGGMVAVYFSFGMMVASIPPMITEVRTDLGTSRGAMGFALGAWTTMYIVLAPLGGRVVDRLGIRIAIALGGAAVALTAFARSFAEGTGSLWLAVAILGVGGPLVSAAAPTLCGQWFRDPEERSTAVTMYNLGPALGGISVTFATNAILLPWLGDWRAVLRFEAAVAVACLAAWLLISARAPALERNPIADDPTPLLQEWQGLIRSGDVRYTLAIGTLSFFVMHSLGNWIVDALSEGAGMSEGRAATWTAAAGVLGIVGLFVIPKLQRRMGRNRLLIWSWVGVLAGLLCLAWGPAPVAIFGVFIMSTRMAFVPMMILTLMASKGVSDRNMGAANGLWFSSAQIGAVLGPFLVGVIADRGLGFQGALMMLVGVGVAAMLLVIVRAPAETPQAVPRSTADSAA